MTSPSLAAELAAALGRDQVLEAADLRAPYERDWSGRFAGRAACVARPGDTDQVAAVVAAAAAHGAALVPQGGNTGLVGGGVPRDGEVVLSLRRLDAVGEVDPLTMQVTAGAGATLAAVQGRAGAHGLRLPLDFGARDTATAGGMAATNAGGILAVRFGTMRAQVAGVEAVLADGSVVSRLRGLTKDNAGYDLASLLVGSEGTLAVLTAVRLKLVPRPRHRAAALLALPGIGEALAAQAALRGAVPGLEAIELMLGDAMELTCRVMNLPAPAPAAAHLLVEAAGPEPQGEPLAEAVAALGAGDAVLAEDERERRALWALREGHSEVVTRLGPPPHKLDVSLPLDRIERFVAGCRRGLPDVTLVIYGHLGDGNLHVNAVGPPPDDERVDDVVLGLVAEHGGSISAEHGIGVAKAARLGLSRSPADIAAMRAVKRALDPAGILNPGVLFPA